MSLNLCRLVHDKDNTAILLKIITIINECMYMWDLQKIVLILEKNESSSFLFIQGNDS